MIKHLHHSTLWSLSFNEIIYFHSSRALRVVCEIVCCAFVRDLDLCRFDLGLGHVVTHLAFVTCFQHLAEL